MRTEDLIATGTLSVPTPGELGCLPEATRGGTEVYEFEPDNSAGEALRRTYLEDGDSIEYYSARAKSADGLGNVGFGVLEGTILAGVDA